MLAFIIRPTSWPGGWPAGRWWSWRRRWRGSGPNCLPSRTAQRSWIHKQRRPRGEAMLSIQSNAPTWTCEGMTRRELLRVGGLALGGLALGGLLRAGEARSAVRGKSVVLLFLQGGPPQIETWDPRPD